MTPEQKAEAMRLAVAYATSAAFDSYRKATGIAPPSMPARSTADTHRSLDSYLTALIDKPTIARIDGEGSSSLD